MTNDLSNQLRLLNTFEWMARPATTKQICFDAADRIEKLEDELHHCFHRINELQAALRRLIDYGMVSPQDLERAQKALEGKND